MIAHVFYELFLPLSPSMLAVKLYMPKQDIFDSTY